MLQLCPAERAGWKPSGIIEIGSKRADGDGVVEYLGAKIINPGSSVEQLPIYWAQWKGTSDGRKNKGNNSLVVNSGGKRMRGQSRGYLYPMVTA